MSEAVFPQRDTYGKHWLITISILATAWFLYSHYTRPIPIEQFPVPTVSKRTNGYFILRMPPITSQYESGIETMRARYAEWLEALAAAGYRPILFSDIRRLTSEQAGLPPKSVVLMFDPGFRRTYFIVEPILKKLRWNAVWMSDHTAMDQRHREYITFRTARQMVSSGGWDVGLTQSDGSYLFDIGQDENFRLGLRQQGTWTPTSGGMGYNSRSALFSLNCLNVNSDWLAPDLVNRLNAELPVEGAVYFSVGVVQNLMWGTTQSTAQNFSLAAEPQQRSSVVSWLGTKGIENAKIRMRGRGLAGTLSMRLRWDEISLSGVQISIMNDKVTIQDWKNGEVRPIYKYLRAPQPNFNLTILLVGDDVAITVDGARTDTVSTFVPSSEGKGVTQLYLHDGVMGAARTNDLQVYFEPLPDAAMMLSSGSDAL